MLEFDITKSTYSLINSRLASLENGIVDFKCLRDDILGNSAIRNTYIKLGLLTRLDEHPSDDSNYLKALIKESDSFLPHAICNIKETSDFRMTINQLTDSLYDFSSCIDEFMISCNINSANIDLLLDSPFLTLCAEFLRSSQSMKIISTLLTFLSCLCFDKDAVRKKVVDLGLLKFAVGLLEHKSGEAVLSSCLLLRSVSRSVKLIRTSFDGKCFDILLNVQIENLVV